MSLSFPPSVCVFRAVYVSVTVFFICEHVSAWRHWHTSVLFVAMFVNVTQDSQIEGAIVSAGGHREWIRQLDSSH